MARTIKIENASGVVKTWVGKRMEPSSIWSISESDIPNWFGDTTVLSDIDSGNLKLVKSEGPTVYYTVAESQKIYAGILDLILIGGQGYEFLCTDISGAVVWNPGTVAIQEEGVQVGSIPFSTLNFSGDITITDAGSGTVDLDVHGVTGGEIVMGQLTGIDSQLSGLTPFVVDTSRANKKLSIESPTLVWMEQVVDDLDWIDIHKSADADAGYVMPFDGTIVVSTVFTESAAGATFNMELYINGTKIATMGILTGATGVNVQDGHSDLNIDFVAGDKLRVRGERTAGSTSLGDTIVTVWVKWRTT